MGKVGESFGTQEERDLESILESGRNANSANALAKQKPSLGPDSTRGSQCARHDREISVTRWAQVQRFTGESRSWLSWAETCSPPSVLAAGNQATGSFLGSRFAKCL